MSGGDDRAQRFELRVIGWVESPVTDLESAPRQGDEGAPVAAVRLRPEVRAAAKDVAAGDELIVLTWLHVADRETLVVHPRGDESRPLTGVFSTRSPHRPNPIGLHRVTVLDVAGDRIEVDGLEAIDGTPVVDMKSVLGHIHER